MILLLCGSSRELRQTNGRAACALSALLLTAFVTASVTPAHGQPTAASPQARSAQYLFIIDDSGSMAREIRGEPGADPDRLAVFAVSSLISMLDDRDEVSLIRLNGAGQDTLPIAPIATNKQQLDRLLNLEGPLAEYGGDITPCKDALDVATRLLNRAYRPNVPQVVMFLTDGRCTPDDQRPSPEGFLGGLSSRRDGLFRFYLLRFQGRKYSRELQTMAEATGGQAIEVSAEDPTAILGPFADALSRSQGYEAELLSSSRPRLAAHRGARRVRLLAVAPGHGDPLSLAVYDGEGRKVPVIGGEADTHQYRDGRVYRYVAADYRPPGSPVSLRVTGAGDDWKAVALPEYRLALSMRFLEGECSAPGQEVLHGVEAGSSLCAVIGLVNERGRVVEAGITGGEVSASMTVGEAGGEAQRLPANPAPGGDARFFFELRKPEPGNWIFQPELRVLLGDGRQLELKASPVRIQVSSLRIEAVPARFDLGPLRPGDEVSRSIEFRGNFPATGAALRIADRPRMPACITTWLSGKPEGASQPIHVGNPYTLVTRVAPFCGPDSFERSFSTVLRLVFDVGSGGQALPTVEIPLQLTLEQRLETKSRIEITVDAGDSASVPVPLGLNATRAAQLKVAAGRAQDGWPGDRLQMYVTAEGASGDESSPLTMKLDPATGPEASPLRIEVSADRCCAGGVYRRTIGIAPATPEGYALDGDGPRMLEIPIEVTVNPAGLWACRGGLISWLILLLLLVLLIFYLVSMVRHSRFLDRTLLGDSLKQLVWTDFGTPAKAPRKDEEIHQMVREALSGRKRARAWLKANPLYFGLPGKSYNETVELQLQPERDTYRSRVSLLAERDAYRRISEDPDSERGKLFASSSGGGLTFFAVLKSDGRIGRMQREHDLSYGGFDDEERQTKVVTLRRREKLLNAIDEREREEGTGAGWEVG